MTSALLERRNQRNRELDEKDIPVGEHQPAEEAMRELFVRVEALQT